MFRSLQMRLVLILVLLVTVVMVVVGAFLISSVTAYQIKDFQTQISQVFTPEFILQLEKNTGADDYSTIRDMLTAYSGLLGVDSHRNFFVLDGKTGEYLAGSDDSITEGLVLTPNMTAAMSGNVGQDVEHLSGYLDVAVPLRGADGVKYVVGVYDTREELNELTFSIFSILVRTMVAALLVAIFLSFLLSKTITRPVGRLTEQARKVADGDFSGLLQVHSHDEIGELTETFNEMAEVLEDTLGKIEGERDKLDTIFRHMADGVVAFDRDGGMIHINPAAAKMLDRNHEPGTAAETVFPNADLPDESALQPGLFHEMDYTTGQRVLKVFFARYGQAEGGGLLAVIHDITEQHKLEKSQREFVANVSHELRTPLTNIRGYTDTIIESGDDLDAATRARFLKVVSGEADRMTNIVKDLLTLSRLDYETLEVNMGNVDLADIAESSIESMIIEAEKKKVTLYDKLPETPLMVAGDRARLQQVVVNIISNAIKYNRPGGEVTVSAENDGKYVRLFVKDTGIGVPEADLPHIFERFYRVDKARSRSYGGTGLGLPIAKQIVELHGGSMTFDSVFGEGSTLTVCLPVLAEENDEGKA